MAFGHGSKAVFKITDAGGTLRDISAWLTSVAENFTADVAEITALGSLAKAYIAGLVDGTIDAEGKYDPTPDGYLAGILGFANARAFEYHPQGTAGGTPKYTGSCFLTSYNPVHPVDDAGSFTASFQVTGAVTRGSN